MKTKARVSDPYGDNANLTILWIATLLLCLAVLLLLFSGVSRQTPPTSPALLAVTVAPNPTRAPSSAPSSTRISSTSSTFAIAREPFTAVLETDADVLLGPDGMQKDAERNRIKQQIRDMFRSYSSQQAGIVLAFGVSPEPSEGNKLAAEVNQLLLEESPEVFGLAALRNFHTINADRSERGKVEIEVHFLLRTP